MRWKFGFVLLVVGIHASILFWVIPQIICHLRAPYVNQQYPDLYDQLASNLVNGNGYRMYPDTAETLMREPGYPFLLAGLYSIFGNSFELVKLANMVMAFVVAWLTMRLAEEVTSNRVMILGPPLLFLLHPGTLVAESRGGVEILYALCLMVFMLSLYAAIKTNSRWCYARGGAVLGLTLLVRSVPILFPVVVLVYVLIFERPRECKTSVLLQNVGVMVVAMLVVISPWIVRNYRLTGKFVPTASVLGVSAQAGQYFVIHHASADRWVVDEEAARERNTLSAALGYRFRAGYYQFFYSSADELKFSKYLFQRVKDRYLRCPKLFGKLIFSNMFYFWVGGKTKGAVRMNCAVQLPFLTMALLGVGLSIRDKQFKLIAPMVLLTMYSMAVSVPILAQARYSVPLIPFVSILAFVPVQALQRLCGPERRMLEPRPANVRAHAGQNLERTDRRANERLI